MTRAKALLGAVGLAMLVGCGSGTTSYVHSNTTLGRVVVYRNGIAYFTTIRGAQAAIEAIDLARREGLRVAPLQGYQR